MQTIPLENDPSSINQTERTEEKELSALNDILGITEPGPYYWEENNPPSTKVPMKKKVWHNFYWALEKTVDGGLMLILHICSYITYSKHLFIFWTYSGDSFFDFIS